MSRSNFYHRLKFVVPLLKPSPHSNNTNFHHKYLTCFAKHYKFSESKLTTNTSAIIKSQYRRVFSSNLTKSDSNSGEHSTDKPNQSLVDDKEFQNILKDFAKDFNVGSESEQILEDIKKSLDEPDASGEISSKAEKHVRPSSEKIDVYSAIEDKFKEFSDKDSVVIHSYEDFQSGSYSEEDIAYHIDEDTQSQFSTVPAKRGVTGVYDIEELVEMLRKESLLDIAVISVPKKLHYADFLVLATAKSPRHSKAVAEYVIKQYKMKKYKSDPFIVVEGEKAIDWKAVDMGNIVLHIFLEETRDFYDIESLWLFDSKYDSGGTLKPDPLFDAINEQMAFFSSLQDSSPKESTKEIT